MVRPVCATELTAEVRGDWARGRKCCPMWGSISNLAPYAGPRRGGRLRDRYPLVRFAAWRISRSRRGRSLRSRCWGLDAAVSTLPGLDAVVSTLPGLDAARSRRCPVSTLPGLDAARPRFFGLDAAVSMLRSRSRVPGQRGGDRDRSAPRRPSGPVIGPTGRSFRPWPPARPAGGRAQWNTPARPLPQYLPRRAYTPAACMPRSSCLRSRISSRIRAASSN
jgi:hypothetical protein